MGKRFGTITYIDRNPDNLEEGWGWVEIRSEDIRRFRIPLQMTPARRRITRSKEITVTRYDKTVPYTETYTNTYDDYVRPPSRGVAAGKKFTLSIDGELVIIKVQKSLTIRALSAWIKTWASPNTQIITPGNRTLSLNGEKLAHQTHFIYFILNEDSNAVKIGRAKNLEKRMKALQTSSPARLKLIKSVQVKGSEEAQKLERLLHQQFEEIRLAGEWFKAETHLLNHINKLS